jgi:hypothetical protein
MNPFPVAALMMNIPDLGYEIRFAVD